MCFFRFASYMDLIASYMAFASYMDLIWRFASYMDLICILYGDCVLYGSYILRGYKIHIRYGRCIIGCIFRRTFCLILVKHCRKVAPCIVEQGSKRIFEKF